MQPSKVALQRHLNEVHNKNPGFTELIASKCRDIYENNSYDLLLNLLKKKTEFKCFRFSMWKWIFT